ncbi:hypothetical protein D6779_11085 [Candidatus Parcubacteria bacterium]|nr:MAG: hypothetical protein D6779_11085 [Candidatus Parcubacteria bacterium]
MSKVYRFTKRNRKFEIGDFIITCRPLSNADRLALGDAASGGRVSQCLGEILTHNIVSYDFNPKLGAVDFEFENTNGEKKTSLADVSVEDFVNYIMPPDVIEKLFTKLTDEFLSKEEQKK